MMSKSEFESQGTKPVALEVQLKSIPEQMTALRQWVCWDYQQKTSNWTKVPLLTTHNGLASTTNPSTWGDAESAYIRCKFGLSGIGFVFTASDPFCGIDLDDCRDATTGVLEPWAQAIVDRLTSYTEVSPSGTGVKIICRAALAQGRKFSALGVELYDRGRYFTITGHRVGSWEIESRQQEVDALVAELEAIKKTTKPTPKSYQSSDNGKMLTDDEIIEKAHRSKSGHKFGQLWSGGFGGHSTHSEADLALCNLLAFYVGRDPERIAALFARSGLYRSKWDREDYRKRTIDLALRDRTEFYDPNYQSNGHTSSNGATESGPAIELPPRVPLETFPVEAFPPALQQFAREVAESMNCPVDFPCLAMLALAGSAIGNSRALQVKRGWRESGRFWIAIVAPPGSSKSPAVDACCEPLFRKQAAGTDRWRKDKAKWDEEKEAYDRAARRRPTGLVPEKPGPAPIEPHWYTTDATVEVLNSILQGNPRGICLVKDEITGWVLAMNQYKGGKGADRQFFLSSWSGATSKTDRKNNLDKGSLMVARPFVNILGGIQPDMLHDLCDERGRQDGFVHRVLFCHHDLPDAEDWTQQQISESAERAWGSVLEWLYALEMEKDAVYGVRPKLVHFTPEGKAMWVRWYNDHQAEIRDANFPDQLNGPWSKLRAYCARTILVVHMLRLAIQELTGEVDEDEGRIGESVTPGSVVRAAAIVQYFKWHIRSVYRQLRHTRDDDRAERVMRWLARRPNRTATVRDLQRADFAKRASEARALIRDMADRGLADAICKGDQQGDIIAIRISTPNRQTAEVG